MSTTSVQTDTAETALEQAYTLLLQAAARRRARLQREQTAKAKSDETEQEKRQ
jgi:hypothetical protein